MGPNVDDHLLALVEQRARKRHQDHGRRRSHRFGVGAVDAHGLTPGCANGHTPGLERLPVAAPAGWFGGIIRQARNRSLVHPSIRGAGAPGRSDPSRAVPSTTGRRPRPSHGRQPRAGRRPSPQPPPGPQPAGHSRRPRPPRPGRRTPRTGATRTACRPPRPPRAEFVHAYLLAPLCPRSVDRNGPDRAGRRPRLAHQGTLRREVWTFLERWAAPAPSCQSPANHHPPPPVGPGDHPPARHTRFVSSARCKTARGQRRRPAGRPDAAQRSAVTSASAPLCLLASAGAGKTRVLTRRIAYRVTTGDAEPRHTLAVTFTRKAAGELQERLRRLGLREQVSAGTFHALASAQLHRWWADRGQRPPALLDRKTRLLGAAGGRPAGAGRRCRGRPRRPHRVGPGPAGPPGRLRGRRPGGRTPPLPWSGARRRRQLVRPLPGREGPPRPGRLRRSAGPLRRRHGHRPGVRGRPALALAAPVRGRVPGPQPAAAPAAHGLAGNLHGPVRRRRPAPGGLRLERRRPRPPGPGSRRLALDRGRCISTTTIAARPRSWPPAAAVLGPAGTRLRAAGPDGPPPTVRAYPSETAEAQGIAAGASAAKRRGGDGPPWRC